MGSPFPAGITLSLTEAQGFTALGNFLEAVCGTASTFPFEAVRALGSTATGANVRVPEPSVPDFAVMSSLRYERLETNETTFQDNVLTNCSISATTLTVGSITRGTVPIGALLIDLNYPSGNIQPNTTVLAQLTGPPGGAGTYTVSVSQTLSSETFYAGQRLDQVGTEWVAQVDIHGPNAANNATVVETLFRSEYGVDFFAATGFWIAPLHVDNQNQMPFENAEQEIEWRWVLECHLQIVPVTATPQQFADHVHVHTVEAGVIYTGP